MKGKSRTKVALLIGIALLLIALPLLGACGKEVVKEVVKEVPVVKEVVKEVPVEKVVVKEVPVEVIKEVPVEKVVEKEVIKEVPVEIGAPIKVGVLGPMKFPVGMWQWWGAKIAMDEINLAGGVKVGDVRRMIEVIKMDNNELLSVPDAVATCERAITFEKVDFINGGARSEAVLAMQDVAMDNKKLFMLSGTNHREIVNRVHEDYDRYKYTFRTYVDGGDQAVEYVDTLRIVGNEVRRVLGIEEIRVAILAEKAIWPETIIAAAEQAMPKFGMQLVGEWRPSSMATDVTAELTAIREAGAHIIFTFLSGPVTAPYARQWSELKIPAASTGSMQVGQEDWEATGGAIEYMISSAVSIAPVEITFRTKPFWDKYVEVSGGMFPTNRQWETYSNIYIVKEAIERAGTLDADVLVPEIEKTDFEGPGGRYVYHPREHELAHNIMFGPAYATDVSTQWQEGEYKCVWPPVDGSWKGLVHEGTVPCKLPPWMVEYWQKNL